MAPVTPATLFPSNQNELGADAFGGSPSRRRARAIHALETQEGWMTDNQVLHLWG